MGLTGWLVVAQLPGFGLPPPWPSSPWLIALVPISALFSALCLALAAFARSTKEGQYYLMPLLLVTMPLVILPMSPGVELNLGNSLIPITGVVLLLRSVLEGNYWQAVQYSPCRGVGHADGLPAGDPLGGRPVQQRVGAVPRERAAGPWALAAAPAARPASRRPTVAAAVCCGVLILVVKFFLGLAQPTMARISATSPGWSWSRSWSVIAAPALLMTFLLDRQPAANAAAEAGRRG